MSKAKQWRKPACGMASQSRRLTKRQFALIKDLFGGEFDEQAVLNKHKVSRNVYNKWLADELFSAEFSRRITVARLQAQALIAKYSLLAAAKLVELTNSQNQETARKVCLDIIFLPKAADQKNKPLPKEQKSNSRTKGQNGNPRQLSAEKAGKLLAALAEERKQPLNVK